jgi:peroxiredoxin Q/BCP
VYFGYLIFFNIAKITKIPYHRARMATKGLSTTQKNSQNNLYSGGEKMEIGSKIDNFCFKGIDKKGEEKDFALYDFEGQNIILYFYPKDNTSGCTQEACDFRDSFNRLKNKAIVIGISPDSIASHKKFKEKQGLNFILGTDADHKIAEAFGAWGEKSMYGKKYFGIIRSTFIIGKDLTLKKSWTKVKVKGHVDEVLSELETL